MRTFVPCPVTQLLESVGGPSCLLGLVAMSTSSQELYASLKALTVAVKTDKKFAKQLIISRSYQVHRSSFYFNLDQCKPIIHLIHFSVPTRFISLVIIDSGGIDRREEWFVKLAYTSSDTFISGHIWYEQRYSDHPKYADFRRYFLWYWHLEKCQ